MANRFVFRQPVKSQPRRTPATYSEALVEFKHGRLTLAETEKFIESRVRKFAEPSQDELERMRQSWRKHAPKEAKGLYLKK